MFREPGKSVAGLNRQMSRLPGLLVWRGTAPGPHRPSVLASSRWSAAGVSTQVSCIPWGRNKLGSELLPIQTLGKEKRPRIQAEAEGEMVG